MVRRGLIVLVVAATAVVHGCGSFGTATKEDSADASSPVNDASPSLDGTNSDDGGVDAASIDAASADAAKEGGVPFTCLASSFLCDTFNRPADQLGGGIWTSIDFNNGSAEIVPSPEDSALKARVAALNHHAYLGLKKQLNLNGKIQVTVGVRFNLTTAAGTGGATDSQTSFIALTFSTGALATFNLSPSNSARISHACASCPMTHNAFATPSGFHDLTFRLRFTDDSSAGLSGTLDKAPIATQSVNYPIIPAATDLEVRIGADHENSREGVVEILYEHIVVSVEQIP